MKYLEARYRILWISRSGQVNRSTNSLLVSEAFWRVTRRIVVWTQFPIKTGIGYLTLLYSQFSSRSRRTYLTVPSCSRIHHHTPKCISQQDHSKTAHHHGYLHISTAFCFTSPSSDVPFEENRAPSFTASTCTTHAQAWRPWVVYHS